MLAFAKSNYMYIRNGIGNHTIVILFVNSFEFIIIDDINWDRNTIALHITDNVCEILQSVQISDICIDYRYSLILSNNEAPVR